MRLTIRYRYRYNPPRLVPHVSPFIVVHRPESNEFTQYLLHCEQNLTSQGSNKCADADCVDAGVWGQFYRLVMHIFKYNNKNVIEIFLTLGISMPGAVPVGSVECQGT